MGKVIGIEEHMDGFDYGSVAIEISWTDEALELIQAFDEYVQTLPITGLQHDQIGEKLTEMLNQARRDAYLEGFKVGSMLGRYIQENGPLVDED